MKKFFRGALFASLSFSVLAYFYPGFRFAAGRDVLVASVGFAFIYLFVRPLLKIASLPFNMITFGAFSLVVNIALLYLLASVVSGFQIVAFQFPGAEVAGFSIPSFYLSSLLSAGVASFALTFLASFFFWIFQ